MAQTNQSAGIAEIISMATDYESTGEEKFIQDFVYELIKIRKSRKFSQEELAKKTGLAQSTISRIETFRVVPTLPVIYKIINALGCKLTITLK